jgi:hypothetical protein
VSSQKPINSFQKNELKVKKEIISNKIKMEDVEYKKILTGPIDELQQMNLIDFRRLDDDPAKAVEKIEDKLKFLEEDSYAKRLAGIKAWRISPLNKMYLDVGQESIMQKKSVIKIIQSKKNNFLTEQEFSAIMDLNKNIKF